MAYERRQTDAEPSLTAALSPELEERENHGSTSRRVDCQPLCGHIRGGESCDGLPRSSTRKTGRGHRRLRPQCRGPVRGGLTPGVSFGNMRCATHRGEAMTGMWARLQADLNVKLRRGAWYRITRLDPLRAVLEVGGRLLEIPSAFLQVIERPPRRWSVV